MLDQHTLQVVSNFISVKYASIKSKDENNDLKKQIIETL
jgi:hypothetical protein